MGGGSTWPGDSRGNRWYDGRATLYTVNEMQPARIRTPSGRQTSWLLPARTGPHGEVLPGPGRPLPKALQKDLAPFFPTIPLAKVRVHQGVPPALAASAGVADPIAVTIRRDIFVAPGYGDWETESGLRTLIHELAHVAQWEEEGDKVYHTYRRETRWKGYWGNPLEREAYALEDAVAPALVTA